MICQEYIYFRAWYEQFAEAVADYSDQFDLFYCDDSENKDIRRYINVNSRKMPLPLLVLVDPQTKTKYETTMRNKFCEVQTDAFVNIQTLYPVKKVLEKTVELYLEEKLPHFFQSQFRPVA